MSATVSPTETDIFTALRSALGMFGLTATNPALPVSIVRGQVNRVPQPAGPDHIVLWPTMRDRLAMNIDSYIDTQITGSIGGASASGSVLTVTDITRGFPAAGQTIYAIGVITGCQIVRQLTGDPGETGTYAVTPCATTASQTLYCGTIAAMQETEVTIQADVHGPSSPENAQRLSTLWRAQFGFDVLGAQNPTLTPLYTSDPRQLPFDNAEQQVEERWIVDLCMQANVTVTTTMQFTETLKAALKAYPA